MADRVRPLLLVCAIAACATSRTPGPPPVKPAAASEWPVPVRVLVRELSGEVRVHAHLPADPPPALPTGDRWFVEPVDLDLDAAELDDLVDEVGRHAVPGLSLRGARRFGDAGLERIAVLDRLVALDLSGTAVTGKGLAALAPLTRLRALYLGGVPLTDLDLIELAARHRALEAVDLEDCPVGDDGAAALANLPLQHLGLARTRITDRGAAALAPLAPSLVVLDLSETAVGDDGLRWMSQAKELVHLGLWKTRITDATLEGIDDLPFLRVLDLAETGVTDMGMFALADGGALARLTGLDLSFTRVRDRGAALLAGAVKLESLDLGGTLIDRPGVAALAGLTRLRWLSLRKIHIDEYAIGRLTNLTELVHLDLGETGVTSDVVPTLDRMSKLTELYLDVTSIENEAVERLVDKHLNLRVLHLDDNLLGPRAAAALRRLDKLVDLTIGETQLAEAEVIAIVKALPGLEILDLSGLGLSDAVTAPLARLTRLHTLDLSKNTIGDAGLAALRPLRRLHVLGLADTAITAASARTLIGFPRLRQLVITGTGLTRDHLAPLLRRGVTIE